MIEVSHETPLCYLQQSRKINAYDYGLCHLFEHPNQKIAKEYFDFFKLSVRIGRRVILDNSAYELDGRSFDIDRFAYWLRKLKPEEYIIPDVRNSGSETVDEIDRWLSLYGDEFKDLRGIGVVHGKDFNDFVTCYEEVEKMCDKIAFSFEDFYFEEFNIKTIRFETIDKLNLYGLINKTKPHHLLGCIHPQEFKQWKNISWIETIDTSSPVLHAFLGIDFTNDGLEEKNSIKINDIFESAILTNEIENRIKRNCKIFRSFLE